jgi:hypothetical protein
MSISFILLVLCQAAPGSVPFIKDVVTKAMVLLHLGDGVRKTWKRIPINYSVWIMKTMKSIITNGTH